MAPDRKFLQGRPGAEGGARGNYAACRDDFNTSNSPMRLETDTGQGVERENQCRGWCKPVEIKCDKFLRVMMRGKQAQLVLFGESVSKTVVICKAMQTT